MMKSIEAVKLVVGNFVIAENNLVYRHMTQAVNGQIVDWFPDHILSQHSLNRLDLQIYRFMREYKDEFLSEENKLLSVRLGAAKIFWKSGGSSEAVIYNNSAGERMFCCANWVSGPVLLKDQILSISRIEFYEKKAR